MSKQYIILFFILSSFIFLLQYNFLLFISKYPIHSKAPYRITNNENDNQDDFISIGFSTFEYEQAKLQETKLINQYDLTAVLLHWKRLDGVQNTLQYLFHTHLFKKIIIWNNNPQINLTIHHFIKSNHSKKFIRIINSKENLKDEAKYRACIQAKTRACFYVDDDWNTSNYLKSLIASFRSDPNLLHSVTDSYTFYTNLVWTYIDSKIDLHSGFSWIGCGSIFLRQHAQKHLQLMYKFLQNHTELIRFSDVFFSVWLNNIPVQINTNILYQPSNSSDRSVSFSFSPKFSQFQHKSSVLAIRILEHSLRFNRSRNEKVTFSREQSRRFSSYVKSSSINDDFIFYTNILPFHFQNESFHIANHSQRGTRKNLPQYPNVKYFEHHATWKAVDNDLSTCWHAHREINQNDFYAIDFLFIQSNVIFTISVAHSPKLQTNLDISISFDGLHWLSYRSQNGIYTKQNRTFEEYLHTFLFDSNEFSQGFQSFRYISFKSMEDWDHHFQVCEIQIIPKEKITSIMYDFNQLIKAEAFSK